MKKALLLFIIFTCASFSQEIKFKGYGAAGYRFMDRIRIVETNQETYYEGKFQAEFEVNKHIEAQLDFRGNSDEQRVDLREFSAKFSYIPRLKFEVGNIKRPFSSEYMESEEDLAAVRRSYLTEAAGDLGYTGRSVGIMAYYNTKDVEKFPHSYYLYIYKNNNVQNGIVARYVHHFSSMQAGINYFLLNTGGDYPISTSGFASNFLYKVKDFLVETEVMLMQDPVESIRRKLQFIKDNDVWAWGARLLSVYEFDTGGAVIEEIEPLLLLSYFQPDAKAGEQHTIQTLVGVNFYFDKDVRLRLNGDVLLTKNEFSDDYNTHDSRFTLEVQVRF
jgi:hypothetical protein